MLKPKTARVACDSCSSTGLYCGFMEAKGEAVVCVSCRGTGYRTITLKPFTGRKVRHGIKKVRFGSGMILDNPSGADWMTYEEFQQKVKSR